MLAYGSSGISIEGLTCSLSTNILTIKGFNAAIPAAQPIKITIDGLHPTAGEYGYTIFTYYELPNIGTDEKILSTLNVLTTDTTDIVIQARADASSANFTAINFD